jgi:type II secretory pathway component PulM
MSLLLKIKAFITELDGNEFRKFMIFYGIVCFAGAGFLFYYYVSNESALKKQITELNNSRRQAQQILSDYQKVFQQKEATAQVFSEDKSFYLQQFVQSSLQDADISESTVGSVSSQPASDYTEESVSIQVTNINTEQLCEFLENIEQSSRVFVKHVTINREEQATVISASMVVATFKPNGG